jgi:GTP-sensing pleiotropic transcriptional regulator CodY
MLRNVIVNMLDQLQSACRSENITLKMFALSIAIYHYHILQSLEETFILKHFVC